MTPEEARAELKLGLKVASNGSHPGARALPHSLEAEEYLLSIILLDGEPMLARCMEARIGPQSFYDPKHGVIYEELLRMRVASKPIDIAALAEELRDANHLDQIGGYAFLTQVSSRIPTTAQASYFIDKVREQSVLRELIRSATGIVEDSHTFSGDISSFAQESLAKLTEVASKAGSPAGAIIAWAERRAGFGRAIKAEEPTMFIGNTAVLNRANIGLVTALRKQGKTAVCGGMIGAIVAGPHPHGDTLGFRSINEHEHAVIHFDTEQSPKDHESLMSTILRRAGVTKTPPWLYSYGVKGVSISEQRRMLYRLLRETNRAHKGVHTVALDGVADLVTDPNDPKECNPFVTELEAVSSDYNCSVTCLLHLNPPKKGENTKGRGHLGSQLERKCETELRINTDADGVATVFTECARHVPILEKDGHRFKWDTQASMHMSCNTTLAPKDQLKRDKAADTLDAVILHTGKQTMRFADFLKAIGEVSGIKASAAEDRFYQLKSFGLIRKDMLGFWGKTTPSQV